MIQKLNEETTDAQAAEQVLGGDVNAFEIFIHRHGERVVRIVKKHIPKHQVEEVVQDVFIRAFRSLKGWQKKNGFGSWISGIAIRTCYDFWRQHYRNKERVLSELDESQLAWIEKTLAVQSDEASARASEQTEARNLLDQVLNHLSPEDRMVLELVYLEELSVKEAAELLGWTPVNVKVRSFRARNKLKKILLRYRKSED